MGDREPTRRDLRLGEVRYPYVLGSGCLDRITAEIGRMGADRFVVVTDDRVLELHGEAFLDELGRWGRPTVLSRPPGEHMKSMGVLGAHLEAAMAAGATRRSVVVTFGGGVPGNLGGMVAAMLFRGVRLVHVPTTTVAAMDSVISLKQAVNAPAGKNLLGTYYAPSAVFTDVDLLRTLPARHLRSGLCEAAKNCLAIRPGSIPALREAIARGDLSSGAFLHWLLDESLAAKAEVMADDAREQRAGLVLEYGHTVGHALELCDQAARGAGALSHGEAVALGMRVAARISARAGWLGDEEVALHDGLAADLEVPATVPAGIDPAEVLALVARDNKRGYHELADGEVPMVLLRSLGAPVCAADGRPLTGVPVTWVADALGALLPAPAATTRTATTRTATG